jgi:hypothetical protein
MELHLLSLQIQLRPKFQCTHFGENDTLKGLSDKEVSFLFLLIPRKAVKK